MAFNLGAAGSRSSRGLGVIVVTAVMLFITAGCRSVGSTSSAPPDPAKVAADKQKAIENIKNNPQIPAQVKANILRQMDGKFTPSAAPKAGTQAQVK